MGQQGTRSSNKKHISHLCICNSQPSRPGEREGEAQASVEERRLAGTDDSPPRPLPPAGAPEPASAI